MTHSQVNISAVLRSFRVMSESYYKKEKQIIFTDSYYRELQRIVTESYRELQREL